MLIVIFLNVKLTPVLSPTLVPTAMAPPCSSEAILLMVVFSIKAVTVLSVSKATPPPKVAIAGPFHQEPVPVSVEFFKLNVPEPTTSIKPPEWMTFESPVPVKVELLIVVSLFAETIAPPLIPNPSPRPSSLKVSPSIVTVAA